MFWHLVWLLVFFDDDIPLHIIPHAVVVDIDPKQSFVVLFMVRFGREGVAVDDGAGWVVLVGVGGLKTACMVTATTPGQQHRQSNCCQNDYLMF